MRRGSVIVSALLHVALVIVMALGLPFLSTREFVVPQPLVLVTADISQVTATPTPAPAPEKPAPEKEKNPAPATKEDKSEPQPPAPKEETKPEEKKAPEPKEEEDEAVKPPPPEKKKKDEVKKPPARDFSSVLKNLAESKDKPSDKKPDAADEEEESPDEGQNAPIGEKLSVSEEDAFRAQIEKCWNVPVGARDVENIIVELFMVINPDRTLRDARITDQARYNTDTFFRAVADSALRAVKSPLCSPFQLPPDKYDSWNRMTVTFNPKDMF